MASVLLRARCALRQLLAIHIVTTQTTMPSIPILEATCMTQPHMILAPTILKPTADVHKLTFVSTMVRHTSVCSTSGASVTMASDCLRSTTIRLATYSVTTSGTSKIRETISSRLTTFRTSGLSREEVGVKMSKLATLCSSKQQTSPFLPLCYLPLSPRFCEIFILAFNR